MCQSSVCLSKCLYLLTQSFLLYSAGAVGPALVGRFHVVGPQPTVGAPWVAELDVGGILHLGVAELDVGGILCYNHWK